MNTEQTPVHPIPRDSGEFRIVSMVQVGPHTYRVTTESKRYGRVTQDVVCFPESMFGPERHQQEAEASVTGYHTDKAG